MPRHARSALRPAPAPAPRRAALVLLGGAALALASACGGAAGEPATAASPAAAALSARASSATGALLDRFWDAGASGFAAAWPSSGRAGDYWISASALEVLADAAARTGDGRALDAARAFVAAQDGRGWTRDWFDDEAWMAVALLRLHDVTGDAADLSRAEALVSDIAASAPDDSCCGATPGGLWWDRAHTQKATAANAVTAIAAARLYGKTGDARWLDLARSAYGFWRDHMVGADGRVLDHVLPSGEQVWWSFTYDQGAMIGAALALRVATGDDGYLADARRYAGYVLAAQTRPTSFGPVLFDGASCSGDCDAFKGIAHRHLAALAAADGDGALAALLTADAAAVWSVARDAGSGTFGVDWGAGPGAPVSLAAEVSAATALEVEASVAAGAAPAS